MKKYNNHVFESVIINNDMEEIASKIMHLERLDNNSFLITGACGMLARYFVMFLIYLNEAYNYNIKIFCLVRNKSKAISMYKEFYNKEYFIIMEDDLLHPLSCNREINYVIHAASLASPQYYSTIPVDVMLPNSIGIYNLLEFIKEKHIKSMLFFSSCDIYGNLDSTNVTEDTPTSNLEIFDPRSTYSVSKIFGETLCKSYVNQYNIDVKIARIAHTYTPLVDIKNDSRVFSFFIKCISENKDIILYSDGKAKRPFCYITDAISAYITILLDGKLGEAYNVGNFQEYKSILEIAKIILSNSKNKKLNIKYVNRNSNDSYIAKKRENFINFSDQKLRDIGWGNFNLVKAEDGFSRVCKYVLNYKEY